MNLNKLHLKLNFLKFSLAQNNSVSNFLILQTYLSARILSQSVPLLTSWASSLTLTSFSEQINSVFQILSFSHPDIRRIRHLLPLSAVTALANSLVSSKLDYCNSLYSGISQSNLNKLQRIQNSLARGHYKHFKISHSHHTKNYTGFQLNKESITNSIFSHTNIHKSTTYILSLQ